MRKLLMLMGVLLAAHVVLLFVHPAGATSPTIDPNAVNIGIVFDVGGRGDKSFNDAAYLGAERA
ncbi:MAG: BMP family ABC transporter substrate-binding protein, partial [Gemmatimonadota bacterium]|nr:BMP family ABC transporter substrate-binding protein [Gemmatimonadota bacterium]